LKLLEPYECKEDFRKSAVCFMALTKSYDALFELVVDSCFVNWVRNWRAANL